MRTRTLFNLLAITAISFTGAASANDSAHASPYAGEQQRVVKALSEQETADLQAGRGMGLSKVAELNHFPGPKHLLELAEPMKLNDSQIQQARQLQAVMTRDAQVLGQQILDKEAALEALFAAGRVDDVQAHALIADIGQLQGQLRFVHVNAHLATARILSSEQIKTYDLLRGYADAADSEHFHHHH
jgi:Spy/CpxP family protein refolding chaperone